MKKAQLPVAGFILFTALALTINDTSEEEDATSQSSSEKFNTESTDSKSLRSYIPSLNVFSSPKKNEGEKIVTQRTRLKSLETGKGPFKLGVSKEVDMPKLGPGAFVFIKNRNSFAVLDNENNRINFYPLNPNEKPSSVQFPPSRQALGLSVDSKGQVTMLSRQFDPESGASFPFYEVWKLSPDNQRTPWSKKQNFSFSDRATHGAAQSLEMQSYGNSILFKGLGENEFHVLGENQNSTQKLPGFPTKSGSYIRTIPIEDENGNRKIQIQEFNSKGVVKVTPSTENMDRLNSYRVLPSGLVALDLEADHEKNLPREVVIINTQTGQVKTRSPLRSKEDIQIDQDVFYDHSSVYQLAEADKKSNEKTTFEILQSDIGEE